jgi:hypothetical protein
VVDSQAGIHRRTQVPHTAGVKRPELMACQSAGPACCHSSRPWTRASVFRPGTNRSSRCCISHEAVVYVSALSLSDSYVGFDVEARSGAAILLAGPQCAHAGVRCINRTAERRSRRPVWTALIDWEVSSSGFVPGHLVPWCASGCQNIFPSGSIDLLVTRRSFVCSPS